MINANCFAIRAPSIAGASGRRLRFLGFAGGGLGGSEAYGERSLMQEFFSMMDIDWMSAHRWPMANPRGPQASSVA